MKEQVVHTNEQQAAQAFSKQSFVFDELYGADKIIQFKRQRVRDIALRYIPPAGSILELNCGTGEDVLFFAGQGYHVHATDISEQMLAKLAAKIEKPVSDKISMETCSFTELSLLKNKGPFDHIFSNFGGLNCTKDLDKVLQQFSSLLKPNGSMTLVIISRFSLWELLLLLKGKFKTACRRFFSSKGRKAHIEGVYFKCWYYSPSYVIKHTKKEFNLLNITGLCTLIPPSYIEGFADKHPNAFSFLKKKEVQWGHKWPWNRIGDYFIISLKKKQESEAAGM